MDPISIWDSLKLLSRNEIGKCMKKKIKFSFIPCLTKLIGLTIPGGWCEIREIAISNLR